MQNLKCQICGQEVTEPSHFYKVHKIKESLYYETYLPRRNLLTTELLPFTNRDSYFLTDFNNKQEFKDYLEIHSREECLIYLTDWLKRRKEIKNIVYSPSSWEIKSQLFPYIKFIEVKYGAGVYNKICEKAGLINRYNYSEKLEFDNNKELNLILDSRERKPLLNLSNIQIQTLPYGDYSIENNINKIFVERKMLSDAISTFSGGYERFRRELQRVKDDNAYLIILIEEKFSNIQCFRKLKHIIGTKCTEDFIFHRMRSLLNEFPLNCQLLSADGRIRATKLIETIFRIKNDIRNVDLEFEHDKLTI